jgi:osmotically-inducible protein OsmY
MRTVKSIQRSSSRPAATAVRIFAVIGGSMLLSNLYGCATFDKCGSAGCAGDAKTTANVEAQFRQHGDLGPPNLVNVQTLDHVVYLSGSVSSGLQRDDAEDAAREASDGARIVDTISVIH